jgi:hypothetical protein
MQMGEHGLIGNVQELRSAILDEEQRCYDAQDAPHFW